MKLVALQPLDAPSRQHDHEARGYQNGRGEHQVLRRNAERRRRFRRTPGTSDTATATTTRYRRPRNRGEYTTTSTSPIWNCGRPDAAARPLMVITLTPVTTTEQGRDRLIVLLQPAEVRSPRESRTSAGHATPIRRG